MREAPRGWLSWRITLWGGSTDGWTPLQEGGWRDEPHTASAQAGHLHAAALLFFKSFFLSAHRVINKFLQPIQSNFLAFVVYRGAQNNVSAPDSCPQVSLRRAPNLHFSLKKYHGESQISSHPKYQVSPIVWQNHTCDF